MADARWSYDPAPDARAVAYLEGKGLARSWRWPSIWNQEHAYGFTLAGVHRLDVIAAAKQLTTQAVAKGETYQSFREQFEARLKTLGFAGPQTVTEFEEGPRKVNLSAPWRMRVIYDTNVRGAYAAAEWAAIEDTKADFPALEYQGVSDERTRASHQHWFGTVRLVGDAFWQTHYPPNDWYCRCYVVQISVDELAAGTVKLSSDAALSETGFDPDPATWPEWRHGDTGRVDRVPPGVGPSFAYNAGQARRANLGDLLERKVAGLDPNLARAAAHDLVNLPVFSDMASDAVRVGQARAAARAGEAAVLRGQGAAKGAVEAGAAAAADRAGTFPRESWPVGVLPSIGDDAGGVVVANASAMGHSAHIHPTAPADWRRVQLMLEQGEVWRAPAGELLVFAAFRAAGVEQVWTLALKPVEGAWRVRTLFPSSPRRRARLTAAAQQLRAGGEAIELEG